MTTAMQRILQPPPLPARPKEGHKGLFGRVLILGGHEAMIGAPVLAGTAALRMGSGLVQIGTPQSILPFALTITPELIGLPLTKRINKAFNEAVDAADAIVIGPGMGQAADAKTRLMRLLKTDKPLVIDADALNILAKQKRWPKDVKAKAILTPHPGEMKRLGALLRIEEIPKDDKGRSELATAVASAINQVLVLKGDHTLVSDGTRIYQNDSGNSALSKAGAGDVLCGIIASLLGQGMNRFDAAVAAVHLHGLAGEVAGSRFGLRSPLARDVIDAIPEAIALYEKREL